jgi:hypothetical protein
MNTATVISEINRLNAGVPHLIEELERNSLQLERYIADADKNWHDEVKERFFSGNVTYVRKSYSSQIEAMDRIKSEFEDAEHQIFSMI